MMLKKNAQISVFVIIAIIAVIIGTFIIFTQSDDSSTQTIDTSTRDSQDLSSIQQDIEKCTEIATKNTILFNLRQGGFTHVPNQFVTHNALQIPLYVVQSVEDIPTLDVLEEELDLSLHEEFFLCLQNFTSYKDAGFQVSFNDVNFSTDFIENRIDTNTTFPITIVDPDKKSISLDFFTTQTSFDVVSKFNIISEFLEYHRNDPNSIPLSYLNELSQTYDFRYELLPQNNQTIIYSFQFNELNTNEESEFNFAIMYDWEVSQ